jgi:hypothetical protein
MIVIRENIKIFSSVFQKLECYEHKRIYGSY